MNIDGIGGGAAVTTKVVMLSKSQDSWADVDYLFAQVSVEDQLVDFKPTCGNILAGVGPAAIEMGLIEPADGETEVRVRAVNTGAQVIARIQTPNIHLTYEGDTEIAGAPRTSAPVNLSFLGVVGSSTGAFLPTGNLRDTIQGVEVTCMDVTMPIVIARAKDLGLTGYENAEKLDANTELFDRIESIRLEAGRRIGMGNVSKSVTPKFGLLAPATNGGNIATRYFMPWKTHPTMAVTGAQCLASCALTPGTVSDGLLIRPINSPAKIVLEHTSGVIDVLVEFTADENFDLSAAGLVRTARKLADGHIYIPNAIWAGNDEVKR